MAKCLWGMGQKSLNPLKGMGTLTMRQEMMLHSQKPEQGSSPQLRRRRSHLQPRRREP